MKRGQDPKSKSSLKLLAFVANHHWLGVVFGVLHHVPICMVSILFENLPGNVQDCTNHAGCKVPVKYLESTCTVPRKVYYAGKKM